MYVIFSSVRSLNSYYVGSKADSKSFAGGQKKNKRQAGDLEMKLKITVWIGADRIGDESSKLRMVDHGSLGCNWPPKTG